MRGAMQVGVLTSALMWTLGGAAQPDGPTGTSRQPLVAGTVVPQQTQSDLRLLTLLTPTAGCSASMLNSSWAITAAHCVYPLNNNSAATPAYAASQVTLSAAWIGGGRKVTALKLVVYDTWPYNTNDIALVQVPIRSFDNPVFSEASLWGTKMRNNDELIAYGRGINSLAFQGPAGPVTTQADGQYRTTTFNVASVTEDAAFYSYQGTTGAAVAGGDSGGPTYIPVWDNPNAPNRKLIPKVVGVHSKCQTTCLPGQACRVPPDRSSWQWVAGVGTCTDAAVFPLLAKINAAILEPGDPGSPGSFDTGVPANVLRSKRALYAVNIDEPLDAPPGGAQDVQLTFRQCHRFLRVDGTSSCALEPGMEIWGYDVATHRVLHLPSLNCLNISGAHREAGALIILFACNAQANERWSIISPGTSSTWILRSDFSGMCLTAVPGTREGAHGGGFQLGTPGKLTQMPCNGSTAQQFANADADWARRNGPK